jgi:eukaryotic-like serine/threonine-protein kinase
MRLHDRFVLVERIGVGGMSQVWRATDEVLDRPVAVKMLSAELATDPALREATWQEARAAAQLTHPHLTRVYDYGEAPLPGGSRAPYLVMELVEGQSLADRLAGGALGWREAARIGAQVAGALAAAHQAGVVHHDVKPGNVVLTAEGAKVLDFGIAALVGAADREMLVGTPTYAAPERLRRAPAHPAHDVYSLGVLLHECLTGHPPARMVSWADAADAHQRRSADGAALAGHGLPPGLVTLATSCLSPDPAQRPAAHEVAGELARAAGMPDPTTAVPGGQPTIATPLRYAVGSAAPPPRTEPPDQTRIEHQPAARAARSRTWLVLASVVVGALVLGLTLALANAALQGTDPSADGAAASDVHTATGSPETPPAQTEPPEPQPGPLGHAEQIVTELRRLIVEALDSGRIDGDAADDLWDELEDLHKEVEKDRAPGERLQKVREAAEDMLEEIEDLLDDGEIPADFAEELRELLRPLLPGAGN